MKYLGEKVIEIEGNKEIQKMIIEYRNLCRKTDCLFNTGDQDWKEYNRQSHFQQNKILKLLGFSEDEFFVGFPYSDKELSIRPVNN